jgi:2-dehydro-3-deoxyphosphogluconate aldolase/(4S)-4-hydroxy-2-oxoglutarate aldolase
VTSRTELVAESLERTGLLAVVRASACDGLLDAFGALALGGVELVEVTTTVPGAFELIAAAVARFGAALHLGAGTVLDRATAAAAIDAGATFIVSPAFDAEVVAECRSRDAVAVPGCLTPTEVAAALRSGPSFLKLFPGRVATPGYVRDLLGPFPTARFVPTGNVDLVTAPEYLGAGAAAVGVGKALLDPRAVAAGDLETITEAARELRAVVDSARPGMR